VSPSPHHPSACIKKTRCLRMMILRKLSLLLLNLFAPVTTSLYCQEKKEPDLSELRLTVKESFVIRHSQKVHSKASAAFEFSELMVKNGASPVFAACCFCEELERSLEVKIPNDWIPQITCVFHKPYKAAKIDETKSDVRVVNGRILGLPLKLDLPESIELSQASLVHLQTKEHFCLIGVEEYELTEILVFETSGGKFVGSIPIRMSSTPNGNPQPLKNEVFVGLAKGSNDNSILCISIHLGIIDVEVIDVDSFRSSCIFSSIDGWKYRSSWLTR
jgi:hypothetical protein